VRVNVLPKTPQRLTLLGKIRLFGHGTRNSRAVLISMAVSGLS